MKTETKVLKGGFTADRYFGWEIPDLFKGMDTKPIDLNGAVLVVTIDDPRRLNIHTLSKVVQGAAKGGVKSAVVSYRGAPQPKGMSMFNLFLLIETMQEQRSDIRLQHAIRTGV